MERKHFIDIAKGILILIVIVRHQANITVLERGLNVTFLQYLIDEQCLYISYYMPAFFIITGYCTNFNISCLKFMKKKFCTIMIPAFTLGIINRDLRLLMLGEPNYIEYIKPGIRSLIANGGGTGF